MALEQQCREAGELWDIVDGAKGVRADAEAVCDLLVFPAVFIMIDKVFFCCVEKEGVGLRVVWIFDREQMAAVFHGVSPC